MTESPVGFVRLKAAVDLLSGVVPASADVPRLIATACVQGKLAAAYRRWDRGADPLDPAVWQLPHWRSYFENGEIRLELPLIDAKGRPVSDGRTAPNCVREIFIDEATLVAFIGQQPPVTPATRTRARRGPKSGVQLRVANAMRAHLLAGTKTRDQLEKQSEKSLADEYGASRDTIRKARRTIWS